MKFYNQTIQNLVSDVMENSYYLETKGCYWTDYFCRDDDIINPKFQSIWSEGSGRNNENLDSFNQLVREDAIRYLELYPHKIREFSDKKFSPKKKHFN